MARKNRDFYDSHEETIAPEVTCWLCARPMGDVTEWHHPVPIKPGREGTATRAPDLPSDHSCQFHQQRSGKTLCDVDALLAHEEIGRFVAWIANKPPDFNAPTKDRR